MALVRSRVLILVALLLVSTAAALSAHPHILTGTFEFTLKANQQAQP